jgi:redox-sensitive bicupin YhaK (pirin superfamily)
MSAIKESFALGMPWKTQDPFLFCVYHNDAYPEGNDNFGPKASLANRNIGQDFAMIDGWNMYHGETVPGFPAHPHRGFETITVVNQGLVDHADSLGAAGRYGNGDTQWMTAGKGVQHSEMFPLVNKDDSNPLNLFQIWINLPAKNKFVEPHFAMLWNDQTPIVEVKDNQGYSTVVTVVAGQFNGHNPAPPPPDSWAADVQNDVAVWQIKIPKNGTFELPTTQKTTNRVLYFYEGTYALLNEQKIDSGHGYVIKADESVSLTAGDSNCAFLVLQGKPIGEPVVQYGPFVMNSEAEIQQAYADYRKDQFGGWPWPSYDPIHSKAKGRFAKHIDGRLEEKA